MWDEIITIKSGKKELKSFGFTFGVIFAILGGVALWRGKAVWGLFYITAATFASLGLLLPAVLLPLQKIWMAFSVIVGFFMSRLILALVFYTVITPIGLCMRMLGKDILDERIDKRKVSYWHERIEVAKDKKSYENRY